MLPLVGLLAVLTLLPPVLTAFTSNVCDSLGCVQKASNNEYCYYPLQTSTSASCNDNNGVQFAGVMAAHLAQGHSIAYYGPDNTFLGDSSFAYPANAGIIYLCLSGSFTTGYQSFCGFSHGDNAIETSGACVIALPMAHVDDGCYVISIATTPSSTSTTSTSSSSSSTSTTSGSSSSSSTQNTTTTPPTTTSSDSVVRDGATASSVVTVSTVTTTATSSSDSSGLSKAAETGIIISVIVAVLGLIAATFTLMANPGFQQHFMRLC
ncbi:hypothetical protein BD410DRAFT_844744 [Rickenella mellea]|uniref:Uncharacterized protein n=1 Tax=Rickenella mellea TaxID=50990 RepID=A0A4Y7PLB1_9AGAM|nr:hypothetical protein BD410DRAFT_844744 [Rickenella mellea]